MTKRVVAPGFLRPSERIALNRIGHAASSVPYGEPKDPKVRRAVHLARSNVLDRGQHALADLAWLVGKMNPEWVQDLVFGKGWNKTDGKSGKEPPHEGPYTSLEMLLFHVANKAGYAKPTLRGTAEGHPTEESEGFFFQRMLGAIQGGMADPTPGQPNPLVHAVFPVPPHGLAQPGTVPPWQAGQRVRRKVPGPRNTVTTLS